MKTYKPKEMWVAWFLHKEEGDGAARLIKDNYHFSSKEDVLHYYASYAKVYHPEPFIFAITRADAETVTERDGLENIEPKQQT